MIFDFGKLKNSISCSCIFRKSITSHTKLCNSVRHFHYRLGRAATATRAQMSRIFGHVLAVKTLAIAITENEKIKGIVIDKKRDQIITVC